MQFATLEGKIIQSGGMVVKNVAGLDMGKLMIGSFGTLAAIAVVNFKLQPLPPAERSFLLPFPSVAAAIQARNQILASPLQPSAIDLLNPAAGSTLGNTSWLLAIRAGGNPVVVDRYERELSRYEGAVAFEQERHDALWKHIENLTPRFLSRTPEGAVVRVSCTLKEVEVVMGSFEGPALARAGSGVCYGYFEQAEAAGAWVAQAAARNWKAIIEFAPEQRRRMLELWPSPGGDLEIMRRVKALFDPANLLNRGRLYRLI
jgi:glycolate oxidase FAD binding subunit